jgi:UDP-N-acetyl-D-mannosaminuronic acid dehydrogenase
MSDLKKGFALDKKIIIVGGCGHIGLPLSVALANTGLQTVAYDINQTNVDYALTGKMPFIEENGDESLTEALNSGNLEIRTTLCEEDIGSDFILTLGTPVDEFLNPSFSIFEKSLTPLLRYFDEHSLIILRSTVYPGTTEWLHNFLIENDKKPNVAFCLERVVQCKTLEEIKELPQIVSATSKEAEKRASEIFLKLTNKVITCDPKEAEFAKLFLNSYRYIQFAIANQFFTLANDAGLDFHKIRKIMSEDYPRADGLPGPGFAAGPCLFKDTMQLVSFAQNNFGLGFHAMLVNEGLVLYIKNLIEKEYKGFETNVGLLGMAFKKDCDDIRSSLSYKLKKTLKPIVKKVICTDDLVTNDPELVSLEEAIEQSDVLVLCTPHTYLKNIKTDKPIIDIWDYLNER